MEEIGTQSRYIDLLGACHSTIRAQEDPQVNLLHIVVGSVLVQSRQKVNPMLAHVLLHIYIYIVKFLIVRAFKIHGNVFTQNCEIILFCSNLGSNETIDFKPWNHEPHHPTRERHYCWREIVRTHARVQKTKKMPTFQ